MKSDDFGLSNIDILSDVSQIANDLRGYSEAARALDVEATARRWMRHPELQGLAIVVVSAWLESSPESAEARLLLCDLLMDAYRIDDAMLVEAGGGPPGLMSQEAASAINSISESEALRREVASGSPNRLMAYSDLLRRVEKKSIDERNILEWLQAWCVSLRTGSASGDDAVVITFTNNMTWNVTIDLAGIWPDISAKDEIILHGSQKNTMWTDLRVESGIFYGSGSADALLMILIRFRQWISGKMISS